jgi:CheY-like chemotaxis protein
MTTGRSRKILVVESDPALLDYLSALLKSLKYDVVSARDGDTALTVMDTHSPDITLIGFNMPPLILRDFLATAQSLFPEVRCMLYSAMACSDVAHPYGVKFWAVKPYRESDLKSVLDLCFGGGTSALLKAVQDDVASGA